MFSEYQLASITAIGTLGATFVALFIVIIPAIWKKRKQRNISLFKIKNGLWIMHELLRGYFFYNPTRILHKSNEISYSYDLCNVKLSIKVNEKETIKAIYDSLIDIKRNDSRKLMGLLNNLELLFSGLPQHNTFWILVDRELTQTRMALFKDKKISMEKTVEQIFKESIEFDKKKST